MPGLSALSISAGCAVLMSAFTGSAVLTPSLSTLSAFAVFGLSMLSLFAPFASAESAASMFGLSAYSLLVVTPVTRIPRRQKLIKLNKKEKRANSKKLAPAFTFLLLSKPPFLFPASYIREKRSFHTAFNINCWLLTKD